MNKAFSIILLLALAASAFAQTSQPSAKRSKSTTKKVNNSIARSTKKPTVAAAIEKIEPETSPTPVDPEADRKRFDEAVAAPTTAEKAGLLRTFIDQFPDSELREEAFTYLITARAVVGNELVQAGDVAAGVASFKLAVEEAPLPVPERMFADIISKIPDSLFYGGHRPAAMELAQLIEKKVAASPKQLLVVAAFYLSIENGAEAKRVAEAAISVDPNSASGYQALGLAHRLNFDLEESARAYAKAAELDPGSIPARRSLAEMNRALGKPDAAAAIYREILASNETDTVARQGLILSLFDSGHQKEAEVQLAGVLQSEPRNFALLTSVAYWYAANEQAGKAVEYAQKAVSIEPRYIWGHIVLARGLMKQNKPVDAERALLRARQYGNFPTLDYEIAAARFQAGLYREAVEELQKSFSLKEGLIGTKLGGRIFKEEKSFQDLVGHERRASILQPAPADRPETSEKLRLLFELTRKLEQSADEAELTALADEFVKGSDKMKLHRQLYIANLLLQKGVALPKVAELVKASIGNVDAGLDVAAPGAAVMASELYESRTISLARNEVVLIPEVPRQTLSAILRGRIEELAGWTAYHQKDYPEAVVRLKRAISVLPDKSAWWRSSMWRLGAALEADGKDKEALGSYIRSYVTDRPSAIRYGAIEALYRKVNGTTDGLENEIGPNPLTAMAAPDPKPVEPPKPGGESEPAKVTPADGSPAPAVEPQDRFPRHVPAKSAAVRSEDEKSASNDRHEPVPIKEQPTTSSDGQTEIVGSLSSEPPAESKEKAVADKAKDVSPDLPTDVPVEPPVSKADPVAASAKTLEPAKTENESPSVKAPEEKGSSVEINSAPSLGPVKDQPVPPKADQNMVVTETRSEPKPVPEKTAEVKAETDAARKDPPASDLPKIPTQAPEPVVESTPGTKVAGNDPPAPPTQEKDDPALDKPVNLLRDPFAATGPETTAKPPEKPEKKPLIIINDPFKPAEKSAARKDLFEPVIIKVPGDVSNASSASGPTRRRVIEGKEILSDQQCSIDVSQESIMLLSGGGSLGLLVNIKGSGETKDVMASSSSPRDIEVRPEPEIDGITGRRFYVIKSISEKTGVFQVNLESPCGKREITVHVR